MKLFNSLTRKTEELVPMTPGRIGLYVCGPTVYDEPHIGHARSAFTFDVLRRYLEFRGLQVRFVRNVTDVDDKIIDKARQELAASDPSFNVSKPTNDGRLAKHCDAVAERYLARYHEALARLSIAPPTEEPRATRHIAQMHEVIRTLIARGSAYQAGGDVYFAVRKCPGYGRLSNRTLDELVAGARVEPGERKRDPLDFALWKAAKPGEPVWDSPWGQGRPGWHIECTAMATHLLGDTFDLHGGGVDLIFPHHENEVAQAVASGKPFARVWVHNGLITVGGEKMSKSLGNYTTVERALEQCRGHADALKTFFLGAHYRSPVDYNERDLAQALRRWDGWHHFLEVTRSLPSGGSGSAPVAGSEPRAKFEAAMDQDLNTPSALAVLDQIQSEGQQAFAQALQEVTAAKQAAKEGAPGPATQRLHELADLLLSLGQTLGLFLHYRPMELSDRVQRQLKERADARTRKDFRRADEIRAWFTEQGLKLVDHEDGTTSVVRAS